jgi:hypothetical protein
VQLFAIGIGSQDAAAKFAQEVRHPELNVIAHLRFGCGTP